MGIKHRVQSMSRLERDRRCSMRKEAEANWFVNWLSGCFSDVHLI